MTKAEIIKFIEKNLPEGDYKAPLFQYDKKWRWFHGKDSQGTCPLLDFMIKTEYKSGFLIHIPDQENKFGQPGNINRNEEAG